MNIESSVQRVSKSQETVFTFLATPANYEQLMPDNIEKFRVLDADRFLFALKGMPEIELKKVEEVPYSRIVLGAGSGKLPFSLTADLQEVSRDETDVTLRFEGEFNAMMAMMVKKPITNFINTLASKLGTI